MNAIYSINLNMSNNFKMKEYEINDLPRNLLNGESHGNFELLLLSHQ